MKGYTVLLDSAHKQCELNTVSSSMIYRYLLENGHTITTNAQAADFIIINSCGYHQDLREKSLALYETYHAIKKPNSRIIMYGCLVNIDNEKVKSLDLLPISFTDHHRLDDIFFQTKKYEKMTPCCDSETRNILIQGSKDLNIIHHPNFILSRFFLPFSGTMKTNYSRMIRGLTHHNKIIVQISQGCLGHCSYCAIKKAKGNLKSRSIDEILNDIAEMYDDKKIVYLVADDCSSYGYDIGTDFFQLLETIHQRFPNLLIQISYVSPNFLVKFYEKYQELFHHVFIPYTTIPFQSGSNKIIKRMDRLYDTREVVEVIQKLKQVSPQTYFEGHFIIGFPGETIGDFLQSLFTLHYFDYPIALRYSEAKGTKSASFPQKKSEMTKQLRYTIMTFFINIIIFSKLVKSIKSDKDGPGEI
jgi:threonylcarbamoyladenosine tRNA methylthiotransferase CDKAL1